MLKCFNVEEFDTYAENINKNIKNGISLKKNIEAIEDRDSKSKKYGQLEVQYCPNCHDGHLFIKFFTVDSRGESNEISELQQSLMLNQGVIRELAKK